MVDSSPLLSRSHPLSPRDQRVDTVTSLINDRQRISCQELLTAHLSKKLVHLLVRGLAQFTEMLRETVHKVVGAEYQQ